MAIRSAADGRGFIGLVGLGIVLAGCSTDSSFSPDRATTAPIETRPADRVSGEMLVLLGKAIFNDENLSLRRNQACASCHVAAFGFTSGDVAQNAGGSVLPGSVRDRFGTRRPPSAAYATPSPVLYFDEEDGTYVGGNFWDGRATGQRLGNPAAEQALAPFINPVEMALPDLACVIYRVAYGNYRNLYERAGGLPIYRIQFPANANIACSKEGITLALAPADRNLVVQEYDRLGRAVAAFEASPEVNQFSSKYDDYLAGRARLTVEEQKGLALYEGKAGCAGCHPNAGQQALFTDYTYDNIGVPANRANPRLRTDPLFRDLGIGGHFGQPGEYGKQKVATLRNLDLRPERGGIKSYMHNGAFKSLEQVVHFYNTRDVLPDCASLAAPRFAVNCWPAPEVRENVNVDELGNLGLTPNEERAVVAYLKTLSDGYRNRQQ